MPKSPGPWSEPSLKPEEYRLLRDLICARTGILFGQDARFSLERRLRDRVAALNLSSFAEYHHYLRFHPAANAEWDSATELLTTNETYLFRESYQLRAFKEEILPLLADLARTRRRLTVWSAGCSTGEEAYTLAILILESGLFQTSQVRVHGSDISKRCVTAARRGVYGPAAFRTTPPELKKQYFVEQADGFHLIDRVRGMCHFGQMNLLNDEKAKLFGRQDAIFCRNVLIYLDATARKKIIDVFLERLYSGGVLFLGHSESLLNVSTAFELLHLKDDLVYRKPFVSLRDSSNG
jgi:chemotaxis protein methyltransferase CheR